MGRPTEFSPTIAARICQELADGASLRKICEADGMPAASTVCGWALVNETFAEQYARARDIQSDVLVEECRDLADAAAIEPTSEKVQAAKLQIDQRKWQAGKQSGKKYGEKVTQELTGANGAPLNFVCTVNLVRPNGASDQG